MKREVKLAALILLLVVMILFFGSSEKEIILNEKYIYNLYHSDNATEFPKFTFAPDLNNPEEVFEFIFSRLENEVIVYPSENYYYFEFPADGKLIAGNIALFAHIRDEGKFSFAYVDKAKVRDSSSMHVSKEYSAKEGVIVKKLDDFKYSITFKNKTSIFNLNKVGIDPPKITRLIEDEEFVGTSFDESGLEFFLIYNNAINTFYWILNEDYFVPEKFTEVAENIIIGDRTEFAFYNDKENNRRILFGVKLSNTLNNNWYDGPFDQLPDNYIKIDKVNITKYLAKVYPRIENYIDKYSYFLTKPGVRTAIHPYYDYDTEEELINVVLNCKHLKSSRSYACITKLNN